MKRGRPRQSAQTFRLLGTQGLVFPLLGEPEVVGGGQVTATTPPAPHPSLGQFRPGTPWDVLGDVSFKGKGFSWLLSFYTLSVERQGNPLLRPKSVCTTLG